MQLHLSEQYYSFSKTVVPTRAVELEAGAEPKKSEWWSRSLKFEFPFNKHILYSKPFVQIMQWFLAFNGPKRSAARAKKFGCQELVAEPEI